MRKLHYSPDVNPYATEIDIPIKTKRVRAVLTSEPLFTGDGERLPATASRLATYHEKTQQLDRDQFLKVFTTGIVAMYELSKRANRLFLHILEEYEKAPITTRNGWIDAFYLEPYESSPIRTTMNEKTYREALRELIDRGFIAPKSVQTYWVNPNMFFKGDRFAFIQHYTRKS